MTLYFTIDSPHQWVSLDSKGIQGSGNVDSLSALETKGQRCVAVVPGQSVNTRTIELPIRNRQKLMAAIPFAIEDSLISPVDDLHFTLLNVGADRQVSFAYTSHDLMAKWIKQVEQAGISLSAMIPEYLLLPHASASGAVISLTGSGQVILRTGMYLGAVIDRQNLSVWLNELDKKTPILADSKASGLLPEFEGKEITDVEIGSQLVDWLSKGLPEHDAVLLTGDFAQGGQRSLLKKYWPAVAMIVLAGFIKLGSDVAELVWLQKTQAQIKQNTEALYQEYFPGSKLIAGRARVQTRNKLMGLQAGSGGNDFTYLLVTTSGLLKNQRVNIEELDYREGNLIAVMTLNDFAHLDRVKQRLQKDPTIAVNLKQSGAQGNKVQVRFEISRLRV